MKSFEEAYEYTDKIQGGFVRTCCEKLYEYALQCQGTIVEVGVCLGRSASLLMEAARHTGAKVILVDSWELQEPARKLAMEVVNHFPDVDSKVLHMTSVEASKQVGGFDLIHIDADHGPLLNQDCECWLPKLKSGGIACFHDYESCYPDVTLAVRQYTKGWEDLGCFESLAIRRKP